MKQKADIDLQINYFYNLSYGGAGCLGSFLGVMWCYKNATIYHNLIIFLSQNGGFRHYQLIVNFNWLINHTLVYLQLITCILNSFYLIIFIIILSIYWHLKIVSTFPDFYFYNYTWNLSKRCLNLLFKIIFNIFYNYWFVKNIKR